MREKQSRTDPAQKAAGKRILFTGPGGVKDYHITLCDFPHSIGIGPLPSGATGDLNYLLRPAPDAPPLLPKHCYVGEVGWGIEHGVKLNTRTLLSNTQIKRSGFNLAMEDRISQIIQEPRQGYAFLFYRQKPSTQGNQNEVKLKKKRYSGERKKPEKAHRTGVKMPVTTGENAS